MVTSAPSLELWCFFNTMSDSGNTDQLAPQCTAPPSVPREKNGNHASANCSSEIGAGTSSIIM